MQHFKIENFMESPKFNPYRFLLYLSLGSLFILITTYSVGYKSGQHNEYNKAFNDGKEYAKDSLRMERIVDELIQFQFTHEHVTAGEQKK